MLRQKTSAFDFEKFTKKEITDLIARMRRIMRKANGIGLSANQIGLDLKVFVAEIPDGDGGTKFYAVFNPNIEKKTGEKILPEEGCLSIPGTYGDVERFPQIVISGQDKNQKPVKVKAWGLLAHIFQHETDHLNGVLFTDKAVNIHQTATAERLPAKDATMRGDK